MYKETKLAIEKTIRVGKVLFSLEPKEYDSLMKITNNVSPPSEEELEPYLLRGLKREDACFIELKRKYIEAAISLGLPGFCGTAALEYILLTKEL